MGRLSILFALAIFYIACTDSQPAANPDPAPTDPVLDDPEPAEPPAPLDLADDHVVVLITAHGGRPGSPRPGEPPPNYGPQVITSIQWNGEVQWSDNRRQGGDPLHTGTVDVARLRAFVDELRRDGTFDNPALNRENVGPDASSVTIVIDLGSQTLRMLSWHEVNDPTRMIATAGGLQALGGRNPAEVMAAQPTEYRAFIDKWTQIRTAVAGLLASID